MRFVILLGLLCAIGSPQLLMASDDAAAKKNLVGVWKGRVQDGATGHQITFAGDTVSGLKDGERDLGKGAFQVNTNTQPWTLDAVEIKEGEEGRTWLGILSVENDSLKWCVSSKQRPAEFTTGDGAFCLVLNRTTGASTAPTPAAKAGKLTVAKLTGSAPNGVSANVEQTLEKSGLRISGADGAVLGNVWLRVDVPLLSAGKDDRKYPLESGTLLGVIQVSADSTGDFRDLKIAAGVYTMRYGLQPTDNIHEYSKQFRDFVVLLSAADDTDPARITDAEDLEQRGIEMTGESHPAILFLQAPQQGRQNLPAMVSSPGTDGHTDLQVLVAKTSATGEPGQELQLELVTTGYAKE